MYKHVGPKHAGPSEINEVAPQLLSEVYSGTHAASHAPRHMREYPNPDTIYFNPDISIEPIASDLAMIGQQPDNYNDYIEAEIPRHRDVGRWEKLGTSTAVEFKRLLGKVSLNWHGKDTELSLKSSTRKAGVAAFSLTLGLLSGFIVTNEHSNSSDVIRDTASMVKPIGDSHHIAPTPDGSIHNRSVNEIAAAGSCGSFEKSDAVCKTTPTNNMNALNAAIWAGIEMTPSTVVLKSGENPWSESSDALGKHASNPNILEVDNKLREINGGMTLYQAKHLAVGTTLKMPVDLIEELKNKD